MADITQGAVAAYCARTVAQKQEARIARYMDEVRARDATITELEGALTRALKFAQDVWETDDPMETIADNGMTVWNHIQNDAKPLAELSEARATLAKDPPQ